MASHTGIICRASAIKSLAFGSIGASYAAIGVRFENPIPFLIIQNLTDALLTFSFTGNTDHFVLPANGQIVIDASSNKSFGDGLFFAVNTQMYVKRSGTPTIGSVYITTFYGA